MVGFNLRLVNGDSHNDDYQDPAEATTTHFPVRTKKIAKKKQKTKKTGYDLVISPIFSSQSLNFYQFPAPLLLHTYIHTYSDNDRR